MEEGSPAIKERDSLVNYTSSSFWDQVGSVLQCSTAVLHNSTHPEPNQWIVSFFCLQCLQAKVCWKVDDFHLWVLWPFSMFAGRTHTQLNRGIIKQTHQTCRLLQCQRSQRKTLIKYVGSQTRWREESQACIFIPDRNSVAEMKG